MFWFVQIAVLVFSYFASQAIANYQRARIKPPLPGSFEQQLIAPGQPFTILYGTRRVRPQVLWALPANLVAVNIDSHSTFGLFPSSKTLGYQFKFTGLLALCYGRVDSVRNMIFGDNNLSLADQANDQTSSVDLPGGTVTYSAPILHNIGRFIHWSGDVWDASASGTACYIYLPNIFGGTGKGGGFTAVYGDKNNPFGGAIYWYQGNRTYIDSPNPVYAKVFSNPALAPSYPNLAYLVYDDVNIGGSPNPPAVDYILCSTPRYAKSGWGTSVIDRSIAGLVNTWYVSEVTAAAVLMDIYRNPIYPFREPDSNFLGGLGAGGVSGSWEDANRTLVSEGFGISPLISSPTTFKEFIDEVCRTVDGVVLRDPLTLIRRFKLIRKETPAQTFSEKNYKSLQDVTRNDWMDTFNVINVEFADAENFYNSNTVTVKNEANIAMTGGERPLNVQYFMITDKVIAQKVGVRDLKRQSLRLWKGRMIMNRSGWHLDRGDVFYLNRTESDGTVTFNSLVCRVLNVDLGTEINGEVTIDWVEDVFHYDSDDLVVSLPSGDPHKIKIPQVTSEVQSLVGTGTARVAIHLDDSEARAYEIAYRAQVGSGALSAWVVTHTSTPNVGTSGFPFISPASTPSLDGDYNFDAPISYTGPTYIEYRIRYVSALGTSADYTIGFGELHNSFTFQQILSKPTIQWGVTLDQVTGKPTVTFYGLNVPTYTPTVLTGYNLKTFKIWLDDRVTVGTFDIEEGHTVPPALAGAPWITPALDSEIGGVVPPGTSSIVHIEVVADQDGTDVSFFDQIEVSRGPAHQAIAQITSDGVVGSVDCFLAFPNFACTITGWRLQAKTAGQIHLDLWKNNSSTALPTIADSLGLNFGSAGVDQQITEGLFGTPIAVAQGDNVVLNILSSNNLSSFTLQLYLIIAPVAGDPAF